MAFLKLVNPLSRLRPAAWGPILLLTFGLAAAVSGWKSAPHFRPCRAHSAPAAIVRGSRVELHLFSRPYGFELVDPVAGTVLLKEQRTEFIVGRRKDRVSTLGQIRSLPNGVTAEVRVRGHAAGTIEFRFGQPEVLQVSLRPLPGATGVAEAFMDQGERYYGLWEYPFSGGLDNRGVNAALVSPGYQKDAHHASARAPFYVTSGGYGVYVPSSAWSAYHVAVKGETGFQFHAAPLTYYVLCGPTYAEVLRQYRRLAGPAGVPPTWALGSMWWRDDAHKGMRPGVRNSAENVLDDARQLQARHIPASALWIDRPFASGEYGWGTFDFDHSFPHPERMVRDLRSRGMRLMLWSANRFWKLPKELRQAYTIKGPKGRVLDVRRPAPCAYLRQGMRRYSAMGVSGYKVDRGEEGEIEDGLQNEMPTPLLRTLRASFPASRQGDAFLIARNVYDTGRGYSAVWNGDVTSSFSGLRMSVKNALRCGILEFPAWGSDTGGLLSPWAKSSKVRPDKELLARWLEFSAYSPIMEVLIGPGRTPWLDYDSELQEVARRYAAIHHDLIPYTRSCLANAARSGMPVMQPLVFTYPDDPEAADRADEYLYGGQLLVAPVLNSLHGGWCGRHLEFSPGYVPHLSVETNERAVYLPAGQWLDYGDHTTLLTGPRTLHLRPALDVLPVYVREGAIIPRGDVLRANNDWSPHWRPRLRIELFPARSGDSRFEYDRGEEASTQRIACPILCRHAGRGLEIQCGDLGASGVFEIYCRWQSGVIRNGKPLREGRDYRYDVARRCLTIPFSGPAAILLPGAHSLFGSEAQQGKWPERMLAPGPGRA